MRFGSLFSGIGGLDLGLERAGMTCAWQVEIEEYASRVLAKHWPDVPRFRDVRECGAHNLEPVDLIAGGFPCQDVSDAGPKLGLEGERSGLWSEMFRIVCELRPRYLLVENVAALLHRGMGRVLGDLASVGFDAEWSVLPACALGAPHPRERVFVVAYPNEIGSGRGNQSEIFGKKRAGLTPSEWGAHRQKTPMGQARGRGISTQGSSWNDKPPTDLVAYGIPYQLERLIGDGNAVVPQVAQWIGERLKEHARP